MKKKLLLIEDNDALLELVSNIVARQGYEVMEASDGKSALSAIESNDYDVVITDLVLKGINGIEIIRKIKEKNPQTRVVAVSGKGETFLNEALLAGADQAVPKPFKIAEFVQAIEGSSDIN